MTALDPRVELLRVETITRLESAMRSFGNAISETHKKGLHDLITGLVEQALSVDRGRYAYAPPCGAGKTQAAVAVIAATWHLKYPLTFAVSANTIKALVLFKRDLMEAGVPENAIGLRRDKADKELDEELAGEQVPPEAKRNTGDDDRPIMLVSHSRLRGKDGALFSHHRGQPRSLLIWDESMFVSSSGFVSLRALKDAHGAFKSRADRAPELVRFLGAAVQTITNEAERQRQGHAPETLDIAAGFDLDAIAKEEASVRHAGMSGKTLLGALDDAKDFIGLAARPLAVTLSGSGGDVEAVIHYSIVVDFAFSNIAVLDASFALRTLCQVGGIVNRTSDAMRDCKRFDSIKVFQHPIPAGKSTQAKGDKRAAQKAAELTLRIPPGESCLLVVAKSAAKQLEKVLKGEGLDLAERDADGKLRFPILTWGRETSSNAYRHCKHVVLVGVHRRNMHDLAASSAGESDDLTRQTGHEELREILLSEMAHCVLQASNRGAIRVVEDSQAGAMTLHVIDAEKRLADLLLPSMPGATWSLNAPETKAKAPRLVDIVTQAIIAELEKLPAGVEKVSCRKVKLGASRAIAPLSLSKEVWARASRAAAGCTLAMALSYEGREWRIAGRSFVVASSGTTQAERT